MLRRTAPDAIPVGPGSNILVRLGERCNHACPMCSNSGRPEVETLATQEALRRIDRVHAWGFRRVVLTGGEPTIHPGFLAVAERLHALSMPWDLNTHARTFHLRAVAERARAAGLSRAVVSLHGDAAEVANAMSGAPPAAFAQTLAGVSHLLTEGVEVTVNLVLSRLNLDRLVPWLDLLAARFDLARLTAKICFPSLHSQGASWGPIQLRLSEALTPIREARAHACTLGLRLVWESVPNCVLGDPTHLNAGRLGFGETHYLDDLTGDRLTPIATAEAALSRYHGDCARCPAFSRCPGVSARYAERFGLAELVPFPPGGGPWWA
jgi:pyruvate-formate lyase-activating enzyme